MANISDNPDAESRRLMEANLEAVRKREAQETAPKAAAPKSASSSGSSKSSFGQAFSEARKSGMTSFKWNGGTYGTKMKGETSSAKPQGSSTPAPRASTPGGDFGPVKTRSTPGGDFGPVKTRSTPGGDFGPVKTRSTPAPAPRASAPAPRASAPAPRASAPAPASPTKSSSTPATKGGGGNSVFAGLAKYSTPRPMFEGGAKLPSSTSAPKAAAPKAAAPKAAAPKAAAPKAVKGGGGDSVFAGLAKYSTPRPMFEGGAKLPSSTGTMPSYSNAPKSRSGTGFGSFKK